jgi:hypothetical protein
MHGDALDLPKPVGIANRPLLHLQQVCSKISSKS